MSNLPKIGDTIKTGTLEEIKAIEGVFEDDNGAIKHTEYFGWLTTCDCDSLGESMEIVEELELRDDYIHLKTTSGCSLEYPTWAYEALLEIQKKPKTTEKAKNYTKKSKLQIELETIETRLVLVKEGVRLESEIETDASDLKAKRARLAEIKKNGGKY